MHKRRPTFVAVGLLDHHLHVAYKIGLYNRPTRSICMRLALTLLVI